MGRGDTALDPDSVICSLSRSFIETILGVRVGLEPWRHRDSKSLSPSCSGKHITYSITWCEQMQERAELVGSEKYDLES